MLVLYSTIKVYLVVYVKILDMMPIRGRGVMLVMSERGGVLDMLTSFGLKGTELHTSRPFKLETFRDDKQSKHVLYILQYESLPPLKKKVQH